MTIGTIRDVSRLTERPNLFEVLVQEACLEHLNRLPDGVTWSEADSARFELWQQYTCLSVNYIVTRIVISISRAGTRQGGE
jgi:hypothetical protein